MMVSCSCNWTLHISSSTKLSTKIRTCIIKKQSLVDKIIIFAETKNPASSPAKNWERKNRDFKAKIYKKWKIRF